VKQSTLTTIVGVVVLIVAVLFFPGVLEQKNGATPPPANAEAAVDTPSLPVPPSPADATAATAAEAHKTRNDARAGSRLIEGTAAKQTPAVSPTPSQHKPATQHKPAPPPTKPMPASSKVGFTSRRSWQEHFDKHGHEFGKITADEYLAQAQALRDAPLSRDILEATRKADGVICRFDKKSGAFLAYHDDKTIRTFFRPNDGEAYYRRQLTRLPQDDR
jgi:pyocin large subunit-like protein